MLGCFELALASAASQATRRATTRTALRLLPNGGAVPKAATVTLWTGLEKIAAAGGRHREGTCGNGNSATGIVVNPILQFEHTAPAGQIRDCPETKH